MRRPRSPSRLSLAFLRRLPAIFGTTFVSAAWGSHYALSPWSMISVQIINGRPNGQGRKEQGKTIPYEASGRTMSQVPNYTETPTLLSPAFVDHLAAILGLDVTATVARISSSPQI